MITLILGIFISIAYSNPISYQLDQDEESGLYFMISYLGSRSERVPILIDTMSNGTAIKYEVDQSSSKIEHLDDLGSV